MKICHITANVPERASFRYRVLLPGAVLERRGHEVGYSDVPEPDADVHIWHKHGSLLDPSVLAKTPNSIFDITDDHFDNERGAQYREMVDAARYLTCSSRELGVRIFDETGRRAVYIADPYEFEAGAFFWNNIPSVLWFGHGSNFTETLKDQPLDCPLEIVTAFKQQPPFNPNMRWTQWSLPVMYHAFARHDTVIVPRGDSPKQRAKGNNRLVNALRQGKFVVASDIPSHDELRGFTYLCDQMLEGIQWGRANPDEVAERVANGQVHVAKKYSPERIGQHWEEVCLAVCG